MKETHCICLSFKKKFWKNSCSYHLKQECFFRISVRIFLLFLNIFKQNNTLNTPSCAIFVFNFNIHAGSLISTLPFAIYLFPAAWADYYVPYDVMIFFCLQKEGQTLRLIFCRQTDYKYFKGVLSLKTNEFVRVFFFFGVFFQFPLIDFVVFKIINCCEFFLA